MLGSSVELLVNKQRASVDKKKHWLLDSDRFANMLQNNAAQSSGDIMIIKTGEDLVETSQV